ncbi:hypothetical protein PVAND_007879 [Polypedilum vanderplanki]|uniref:Uncharacterized protein n=1 Tax=Polypedilum vanderplanki TaxID=319348 RepID=A0A9J6C820_POLVA|nr:hypothetical protein PVAND_007879 [Polypedilum vanderplanki]
MTKITKQSLKLRAKRLTNKLVVKRMKLTVCDECTSSSDDDQWPILPPLPPTSSDDSSELSPIEEEKLSESSVSTCSETSKYLSSFLNSSVTTVSSISDDESSYRRLHNVTTAVNNDPCPIDENIENLSMNKDNECQRNENGNTSNNAATAVNIDDIGFEPLMREIVNQEINTNPFSNNNCPSGYITLTPNTCEFNNLHRSKNFTFLLMNFALVASNANQLRYLMDSQEHLRFFYISLGLIIASCVFQFIAKTFSLVSYCYTLNTDAGIRRVKCLNTFIVLFAFLTTVVNVGLTIVLLLEFYEIIPFSFLRKSFIYNTID